MPDTSLSISYTVTSITSGSDGMSTVVWELDHTGTALNESRAGDRFKTTDLGGGINTTDDDGPTKIAKVKTNFESLALPYFKAFAKRVRLAQEQSDVDYLDDEIGEVSGLNVSLKPNPNNFKPVISGNISISV